MQFSWQRIFWAGNQGNHQNFGQSLLTYKRWQILTQNFFFFWKKNLKWPTHKKGHLPAPSILNIFSKMSWIGPWVSRIDWCKGHWCCSTYMAERLSEIRFKTGKKHLFCVFRPFLTYDPLLSHTQTELHCLFNLFALKFQSFLKIKKKTPWII